MKLENRKMKKCRQFPISTYYSCFQMGFRNPTHINRNTLLNTIFRYIIYLYILKYLSCSTKILQKNKILSYKYVIL